MQSLKENGATLVAVLLRSQGNIPCDGRAGARKDGCAQALLHSRKREDPGKLAGGKN